MSCVTRMSEENKKPIPFPRLLILDPYSPQALINAEEQYNLHLKIMRQLKWTFERIHHSRMGSLTPNGIVDEGSQGLIVMWDHWQGRLKEHVCKRRPNAKSPLTDSEIQYCWGESEDEEGEGKREDAESWLFERHRTRST